VQKRDKETLEENHNCDTDCQESHEDVVWQKCSSGLIELKWQTSSMMHRQKSSSQLR